MAYKKNRYGSIVLTDDNGKDFTNTKKEQETIKTYVKRANQRRTDKAHRYYDDVKNQANMKGISYQAYQDLMTSKGFLTEKYSSSFKQFHSKDELKDFIKELKTVTKRGYGDKRIDDIRKSMIKRVDENFGEEGNELVKKINSLDKGQLLSLYLHNDNIVQTIYGSGDDMIEIEHLATKSLSDINYYLKGYDGVKKKRVNKKKKK